MGERAVILRPSSDISLDNNLTISPSTLTQAWQAMSEEVADDDSSYIALEKNGAAFAEFGMPCSINPVDIFNVKIYSRVYAQQEVSGVEREDLYVSLSCVDGNGSVNTILSKTLLFSKDSTSSYENHSLLLDTNSITAINNLNGLSSFRVKLERGSMGVTRITQLYLQVDYHTDDGDVMATTPFYLPINGVQKKVESLTIPEGKVTKITNAVNGVVLWSKSSKPVILKVAKMTGDTYAGETLYTDEEFVLLNVYPESGGTVNVTYGGLTKTIVDDGTTETPNSQKVFFGTFNGVHDGTATPSSGTLTIEGDYAGFAVGTYSSSSKAGSTAYYNSITDIISWGKTTEIPTRAFAGCTNLTISELPDELTYIGDYAFTSKSKTLGMGTSSADPAANEVSLTITSLPSKLVHIGMNVFANCSTLTTLNELPNTIEYIGDFGLFGCCNGLTKLPDNLKYIGSNAFVQKIITGIGDATQTPVFAVLSSLPSGLTYIGDEAFSNCTGVAISEIPNGVTEIGKYAFYQCTGLQKTLTMGANITALKQEAFWRTGVETLRIHATTPPSYYFNRNTGEATTTISDVFGIDTTNESVSLTRIIVPAGCGAAYKAATGWSQHASIIEEAS
jgi:hypothetical protein